MCHLTEMNHDTIHFFTFHTIDITKYILNHSSSIGATLAFLTSLPIQDGGPLDFRSKMAAPTA